MTNISVELHLIFINEEKFAKDTGIYQIRNTINDYVYIGQTGDSFQRRYWHHRWKLRNGSHDNQCLQDSYDLHGENAFVFEVLECVADPSLLDSIEIMYIANATYKYNILNGGGGRRGIPMKESTKRLIGQINSQKLQGKKQSLETRQKRANSLKGNPKCANKKGVLMNKEQVILAKQLLMQGKTIREVSQTVGTTYQAINGILSCDAWSFINVDGWDDFSQNRQKKKRMSKEDAENIRMLYNTGTEIAYLANSYGVCRDSIMNIINRKTFK